MAKPCICVVGPLTGRIENGVPTQGEFLADHLAQEGFPVHAASYWKNRYLRPFDILRTISQYRKGIDIQVIQGYSGAGFFLVDLASFLGKIFRHKIVVVLHGGNLPLFAKNRRTYVEIVLNRADLVIAPSSYLAREFSWLKGKIISIPNAIDLSMYPFTPRLKAAPRILWMRAFHEIYNPILAVEAVAELKKLYPEIRMTMGGADLGLMGQTMHVIERSGLQSNIKIAGFLNMERKLEEGRNHDVYINTNNVDNMPVSVIEMAALGLPVVSTNVGGIADLLQHEINALLVPPNDAVQLSAAIHRLIEDPGLVKELSYSGRKLAESFAWENVRTKWFAGLKH